MQIPTGSTLSITAIIGVLGLLWAGLGWLSARCASGIRAIFGVSGQPGNFVMNKLRDLGVLATLGLDVVLVAVLNGMTSAVALDRGVPGSASAQTWIVTLAGLVVSVLANGLLVALMLRVLSGVDLPWRALRNGAIFGGVVMTFLQTFGTRLIAGTMHNKAVRLDRARRGAACLPQPHRARDAAVGGLGGQRHRRHQPCAGD